MFRPVRQVAAPGAMFAISDYILFKHSQMVGQSDDPTRRLPSVTTPMCTPPHLPTPGDSKKKLAVDVQSSTSLDYA